MIFLQLFFHALFNGDLPEISVYAKRTHRSAPN